MEAAAELGRTLLERNRELETTVRQQQAVIDDQTQEMEVKTVGVNFGFPPKKPIRFRFLATLVKKRRAIDKL